MLPLYTMEHYNGNGKSNSGRGYWRLTAFLPALLDVLRSIQEEPRNGTAAARRILKAAADIQ